MTKYDERPELQLVVQLANKNASDHVWPMVTGDADPSNLLCRDLFTYALILCENEKDLERIPVLLARAKEMQNLNEESDTFGNFWWTWGQGCVLDPNAIEFCMRGGALLWLKHQDKLGDGKQILREMLTPAVSACRHHASMPLYTNITLMNAMNLMLLGQALQEEALIVAGEKRFEQFCLYTWDWGIHEFCSPTYTPIQVSCLGMIQRFSNSTQIRHQADVMLQLFWANVAANWLEKAQYLGGTYSRTSGVFLDGDINMIELLWANGVLPVPSGSLQPLISPTLNVIYQGLTDWQPQTVFRKVADAPYPRSLKQRWGPLQNQTRDFFAFEHVALSTTGAQYDYPNYQDVTLATNFNLPLPPMGNAKPVIDTPGKLIFIPDAKSKNVAARYGHYSPRLWAGVQDKQDALGLVLFRLEDLISLPSLELDLMMSSWAGQVWVGDEQINPAETTRLDLTKGPVFFRNEGVAVGIRVVWQGGGNIPTLERVLDDDHDAWIVSIDLTLIRGNHSDGDQTFVGASFWTRIGEGLESDEDFKTWRTQFANAPKQVAIQPNVTCDITVGAAGESRDLQIRAESPDLTTFDVLLEPQESYAIFNLNGQDIGREILKEMPIVQAYETALNELPEVPVPGLLALDSGHIQRPMTEGINIPNTPYFWVSPDNGDENGGSDTGCATWRMAVPSAGRYYFWAEVWPTSTDDVVTVFGKGGIPIGQVDEGTNALMVRVYQDLEHPVVLGTSLISCEDTSQWQWVPLAIHQAQPPDVPKVIALPEGDVFAQVFSHTSGLKVRRVCVTDALTAKPEDYV